MKSLCNKDGIFFLTKIRALTIQIYRNAARYNCVWVDNIWASQTRLVQKEYLTNWCTGIPPILGIIFKNVNKTGGMKCVVLEFPNLKWKEYFENCLQIYQMFMETI